MASDSSPPPAPAHPASYYAASSPGVDYPRLQGRVDADVCIVGAGYTGLATGLHLARAGLKVVVVEAARVGFGASGRNGGQIVHSFSRDLDVIERRYGAVQAQALGAMAFEGAEVLRGLVADHGIDCDLKRGTVFAALTGRQAASLREHQHLWERYGHRQLTLLDAAATREIIGTHRYRAALLDASGGHFHPLKLAQGEARALCAIGGEVYENSRVLRIERGNAPRVHVEGGLVQARFVVVACNAYLDGLEPALAARSMPCGTQIIATEPLGDRWRDVLPSDHCVEDCNYLLDYYRLSADKRLLYGGGVVYGARDPAHIESIVRPRMLKTFPQLGSVRIDYAWSGNFLLTLSRLPDVGRLAENILYSQGCSGHGVTFTHLIGRVLSEAILGRPERMAAFESLPHYPFPGGQLFRVPLTALGARYYDLRDRLGI
ncbi:MAG: FAD-binding oxidoreductase [Caldimonas sp.]